MSGHLPINPLEGTDACPWFGCPNPADSHIWDPTRLLDMSGCRFHITAYRRHIESRHRHPST